MRRSNKAFMSKEPLVDAINVGVRLPSFNFVKPRSPKLPIKPSPSPRVGLPVLQPPTHGTDRQHTAPNPHEATQAIDIDRVVYFTISKWAKDMEDSTLTQESKMARIWQSMLRHSESGRFGRADTWPNSICSALCLEIVRQMLVACGATSLLINVLIGGLANSIYMGYDPDHSFRSHDQYADIARQQQDKIVRVEQHLADLNNCRDITNEEILEKASMLLHSSKPDIRLTYITDLVNPFLTDELIAVLWNLKSISTATQQVEAISSISVEDQGSPSSNPEPSLLKTQDQETTSGILALQERVRLLLMLWHELSVEEKSILYQSIGSESAGNSATDSESPVNILQALQAAYAAQQIQLQNSARVVRLQSHIQPSADSDSSLTFIEPVKPSAPQPLRRTMTIRRGTTLNSGAKDNTPMKSLDRASAQNIYERTSVSSILLGALSANTVLQPHQEYGVKSVLQNFSNEEFAVAHRDILQKCQDVFDLLCESSEDSSRQKREGISMLTTMKEYYTDSYYISEAKKKLCDLLCEYVEPTDAIMEKFAASEKVAEQRAKRDMDDPAGAYELVRLFIQRQKKNPATLVHAINQNPEILLSAIAQNHGILHFAITKFAGPVKRFLKLDSKASDYLDSLQQKNKGVQLLWGTNATTTDSVIGIGVTEARKGMIEATPSSYLMDWFEAHTSDLAKLFLEKPELLKILFADLHREGDVSSFYKLMMEIQTTKGVQNFMRRASVAALEKLTQEDPSELVKLLKEIFHTEENSSAANADLLDELRSSPYLVTCLSEFHPTVLQDVLSTHIDIWKHFFVDAAAYNDAILRESLLLRTNGVEHGDTLMRLFDAVVEGSTTNFQIQMVGASVFSNDAPQSTAQNGSVLRRKKQQRLYLRGISTVCRALIIPQLASIGHNYPQHIEQNKGDTHHGSGKTSESKHAKSHSQPKHKKTTLSLSASPKKRVQQASISHMKEDINATPSKGSVAEERQYRHHQRHVHERLTHQLFYQEGITLPSVWRTYLQAYYRQVNDNDLVSHTLTKAHVKTLILDICLEYLKLDHIQSEHDEVWTFAPFVADYFVNRYEAPITVGYWLHHFVTSLRMFQDESRMVIFLTACGFTKPASALGYDVFLYYLHALAHLFFGQMKMFKIGCRLEEISDGSCPVPVTTALNTATTLFKLCLSANEMKLLHQRLHDLKKATPPSIFANVKGEFTTADQFLDLDDVMNIFLDLWITANKRVDERYKHAFTFFAAEGDHVGLEEFTKIVMSVTNNRLTPRECRLVYGDAGYEVLNLEALLQVTQTYYLRLFNIDLPEVPLEDEEVEELRLSIGRANITSIDREMEDLDRYWRSVRDDLTHQLETSHQNKSTKARLRKQNILIEMLLTDVRQLVSQHKCPPVGDGSDSNSNEQVGLHETMTQAWQEIRACVKMLHSAKVAQHYLSRLFIQSCIIKWVQQGKKRRQEEEHASNLDSFLELSFLDVEGS